MSAAFSSLAPTYQQVIAYGGRMAALPHRKPSLSRARGRWADRVAWLAINFIDPAQSANVLAS
jgi:Mg/Co/Ni transporter MgtE